MGHSVYLSASMATQYTCRMTSVATLAIGFSHQNVSFRESSLMHWECFAQLFNYSDYIAFLDDNSTQFYYSI